MNNISMKDIKIQVSREGERESNHKHKGIISRFKSLTLRPRLYHNEGFLLESIPQDHTVPQYLQVLSDPQVLTYSRKNTTREPASSPRPQPPTSSNIKVDHLVITS